MKWLIDIYRNGEKAAELPVMPGELKDVVTQYTKMFPKDRCICNPIIEFSGEYDNERESRAIPNAAVSSNNGPGRNAGAGASAS